MKVCKKPLFTQNFRFCSTFMRSPLFLLGQLVMIQSSEMFMRCSKSLNSCNSKIPRHLAFSTGKTSRK